MNFASTRTVSGQERSGERGHDKPPQEVPTPEYYHPIWSPIIYPLTYTLDCILATFIPGWRNGGESPQADTHSLADLNRPESRDTPIDPNSPVRSTTDAGYEDWTIVENAASLTSSRPREHLSDESSVLSGFDVGAGPTLDDDQAHTLRSEEAGSGSALTARKPTPGNVTHDEAGQDASDSRRRATSSGLPGSASGLSASIDHCVSAHTSSATSRSATTYKLSKVFPWITRTPCTGCGVAGRDDAETPANPFRDPEAGAVHDGKPTGISLTIFSTIAGIIGTLGGGMLTLSLTSAGAMETHPTVRTLATASSAAGCVWALFGVLMYSIEASKKEPGVVVQVGWKGCSVFLVLSTICVSVGTASAIAAVQPWKDVSA